MSIGGSVVEVTFEYKYTIDISHHHNINITEFFVEKRTNIPEIMTAVTYRRRTSQNSRGFDKYL